MIIEKRKQTVRKWDRENMKTVCCRMRRYEAELFNEYCKSRNTTPAAVIKKYVTELIDQYCEEQDKIHNDNSDKNSTFSDTPQDDESV